MRLGLHFGDITEYKADYFVNVARTSLLGGSGVDGDIHKSAGFELYKFCKTFGCKIGEARLSPATLSFDVVNLFFINNDYPNKFIFCCQDIENVEIYLSIIKRHL